MATKYILHGGYIDNSPDKGKAFFDEIIKGLQTPPKILLCYYARPREDWEKLFAFHSQNINSFWTVKPALEMAYPEIYGEQTQRNDAIVLYGGESDLLYYRMNMTGAYLDAWKNKVIAGSSAGAQILVEKYWSVSWRRVRDGLGIIDQPLLVHYASNFGYDDPRGPIDWQKAEAELQAEVGGNQILKLKEGEFVTIEK